MVRAVVVLRQRLVYFLLQVLSQVLLLLFLYKEVEGEDCDARQREKENGEFYEEVLDRFLSGITNALESLQLLANRGALLEGKANCL